MLLNTQKPTGKETKNTELFIIKDMGADLNLGLQIVENLRYDDCRERIYLRDNNLTNENRMH